uniref:AAA+ ATPase domain-containing protein n=1 Tax=viral metagenome TaxID=1070528 RepID=A0A6C0EDK5_9ZZZZ
MPDQLSNQLQTNRLQNNNYIDNINNILLRTNIACEIKEILNNFEKNKSDLLFKKGIYVYGHPGIGKTQFIINILKDLNYDIITYNAGDIRNKSIIETITKDNMSDKSIMCLFHKKIQKKAIIMDEIDGMNNGDKGGINALIKLIRPKKTKRQKSEDTTLIPIICIGNYHIDKKINELMKVCNVFELNKPSNEQIETICNNIMPSITTSLKMKLIHYIQGDLRKLHNIYNIYCKNDSLLNEYVVDNILKLKSYNQDTKSITNNLFNKNYLMKDHLHVMNETDRTIVALLWHENIIDKLEKYNVNDSLPVYLKILDNICFADYIDRITFQKQIWIFNEMSSLIKTLYNNKMYHEFINVDVNNEINTTNENIIFNKLKNKQLSKMSNKSTKPTTTIPEKSHMEPSHNIRFTKVLTKYSTEYNNYNFIHNLCQQLGMDKKDLFAFFISLKNKYTSDSECFNELLNLFENYEINKLDIQRMYRYLDKSFKDSNSTDEENGWEIEEDIVEFDC